MIKRKLDPALRSAPGLLTRDGQVTILCQTSPFALDFAYKAVEQISGKTRQLGTFRVTAISCVASAAMGLAVLHGFDLLAWRTALSLFDCNLIGIVLLTILVVPLADVLMRTARRTRRQRIAVAMIIATGCNLLAAFGRHDSVELAFGQKPPPGVQIHAIRDFNTPAGGGERYIYIEFNAGADTIQQLLSEARFKPVPEEEYLPPERTPVWRRREWKEGFRNPPQPMTQPRWFRWQKQPFEATDVIWDEKSGAGFARYIFG